MKKTIALLVVLLAGWAAPAQGATVYSHSLHAIHVNAFRPLSGAPADAATQEISMVMGKLEMLVDTEGYGEPEEGGCIDFYIDGTMDSGCGPLTVTTDRVLGTTHISGEIEGFATHYNSETIEFEEIGPSTISFDVTFTGTGLPGPSPYSSWAAGVCGLGPDFSGVLVDAMPELVRDAVATGSITSSVNGEVDLDALSPLMIEAPRVSATACL